MDQIARPENLPTHELLFVALHRGANFAFPCDAAGSVDMDHLSPCAVHNYLLARTLVGRDFATPRVIRSHAAAACLPTRSPML